MKIVCPSCGLPVPGEDIDLAAGRALCKPCGELIPLPGPTAVSTPSDAPLAPNEALAAVPADLVAASPTTPAFRPADLNLVEHHEGKQWLWTITPSRAAALPILGFAAIWDAFLLFWYSAALGFGHGGPSGIMLWFPLLHVGAGFYITYLGLTRLVNHTRIRLDQTHFEVKQLPIPGRRAVEDGGNVLRFEPAARTATTFRQNNNTPGTQWIVKALTKDGRQIDLPIALANADHAAHVAHRLNAALDENHAPTGYRE